MPDSLPPHRLYSPRNSPGENIRVGCLSLLHEIFQTQGSNPGLPHCRQFLYLKPPGKPKNTGVGSLFLLMGIFQTQGLNWGLLPYKRILYQLEYQESHCSILFQFIPFVVVLVTKLYPSLGTTWSITNPGSSAHGISQARILE